MRVHFSNEVYLIIWSKKLQLSLYSDRNVEQFRREPQVNVHGHGSAECNKHA
jgi:hypothetical protein